jgi:hypothetical protein
MLASTRFINFGRCKPELPEGTLWDITFPDAANLLFLRHLGTKQSFDGIRKLKAQHVVHNLNLAQLKSLESACLTV